MVWSTRAWITLAGRMVNTIRHYHRLGLLRVRRLADLGVPLAQIEAEDSAGEITSAALQEVDDELARNIEHL